MENNVQIFDFDENPVRVIEKDGAPWFVAADVCRVLELTNPTVALESLDDDERAKFNLGSRDINIISESGLYILILRCRDAIKRGTIPYRFRKWVTGEVLPSIRKTGRYEMPSVEAKDETDGLPDRSMSQWLKMIRETRLLYGRAAAREMWKRSPLPVINENEETAGDVGERRGRECLDILLSYTFDGEPVSAYIAARDAQALIRCGLKLVSEYDGDFLAIANFHPFLEKVYRKTPFSNGRHVQALRRIRGARNTNAFRFGKFRSRCTIVPTAFVEGEKDR